MNLCIGVRDKLYFHPYPTNPPELLLFIVLYCIALPVDIAIIVANKCNKSNR